MLIGEIIAITLIIMRIRLELIFSVIMLFVMGIDWFIQYINLLQSNNYRRIITGILGGIGLTYIYYYLIIYIMKLILNY